MSDPNDKKPQSPASNWSEYERQARDNKDAGQILEDPLAELDRIVSSGDYGQNSGQRAGASVSDDDLRLLEQELIKELRGQHDDAGHYASASYEQPAVPKQPGETPLQDPMARSYAAGHDPRDDYDPRYATPEAGAYEPSVEEPVTPQRQAPLVSSEKGSPRDSGLEDWSSLFDEIAPAASSSAQEDVERIRKATEAVASEPPVSTSGSYGQLSRRPAVSPEAGTGREDSFFTGLRATRNPEEFDAQRQSGEAAKRAPDVSLGAAPQQRAPRSQEYGKSASGPEYNQPAEPSAPRAPAVDPYARYGEQEAREAENVRPEAVMPSSWSAGASDERFVDPMRDYRPDDPKAAHAEPYYGNEETSSGRAPNVSQAAQAEVSQFEGSYPGARQSPAAGYDYGETGAGAGATPRASRQDPFAVFNDPSATQGSEPYMPYSEPTARQGSAPSVSSPYPDTYANYGADQAYQEPAVQSYGQGYEAGVGGYAPQQSDDYTDDATVDYGTYADPSVARAAAESNPNYQDEDYTTLETAAAMAAPQPKRKSRKGLYAAAAAVGVVVIGGVLAWSFGQSGSGSTETPVIEANTDPVKETPEDPGGRVVPHQDQTVYDRIDGSESDEGPTNMMPATETPLDITANGQSPRVIPLSGGEASVAQSTGSENAAGGAVAPKKVRTVVVRPDGTFVTSEEPAADSAQASQLPNVDNQLLNATPSEQALSQTNNTDLNGNALNGALSSSAPVVDANMPLPKSKPAELAALQAAAQSNVAQPAPVSSQPTSQAPLVLAPTAPAAPAVQTPAVNNNSGAGGYTVQVTSQRTPDQAQASYRNIQAQLSSVLAGYEPDIKEADLGARGVYYRVRVGSFADQAGAINFCNQIKAAGGDCLVARR